MQRDSLVTAHRYLCRRAAWKFVRPGLERSDLEQVAALGLIKASARFDPAHGTPFEAYAWLFIVGELLHFVRDYEGPVRVPRALRRGQRLLTVVYDRLRADLGREPHELELAEALHLPLTALNDVRSAQAASQPLRLDAVGDDGSREWDEPADRSSADDRLLLEAALRLLPERERLILVGVYLLGLRQFEIARRLDMSTKQISRLHGVALGRMQHLCSDTLAS